MRFTELVGELNKIIIQGIFKSESVIGLFCIILDVEENMGGNEKYVLLAMSKVFLLRLIFPFPDPQDISPACFYHLLDTILQCTSGVTPRNMLL